MGYICDNVVNFEVVLASGEIINASAEENSDLFIALTGGANNFGVITRFDMKTFQQGQMWGGSVFYPPDSTNNCNISRICSLLLIRISIPTS